VVDEVDVVGDVDVGGDVDVAELEVVLADVGDVLERAGLEVVEADHPIALGEQMLAEVRAEKAGTAGNHAGRHRGDVIWVRDRLPRRGLPAICAQVDALAPKKGESHAPFGT
jgi:hypothetical protein